MSDPTATPILTRWGRWVAGLELDSVPPSAQTAARYQVLNMVAAVHAAARSEETECIAGGLAGFAGRGRSTVLTSATKLATHDAALANAAYSMAQDFDDIIWMGHTCHSAVFASLAVAEHEGASASAFLTAVIAANEVAGRLGATSFLGPLNGQMWTFIHLVSAAAATAKLLGLDAEQTTNALAIALSQPNFALQPGFMAPSSKLLAAATPTATGIQAAYFARAGMTGEARIIEDPKGFWARFSYLPLPAMADGLGEQWALDTLTVKTYPGCHYFQTACTALERIIERLGGVEATAVKRVVVETTKLGTEVTRFAGEYAAVRGTITPVNVNFDLGVTLAILLTAGRLTSDEVQPRWLAAHSDELHRLREKTKVVHAPQLTLRTIESARAIGAGRDSLATITASDIVSLVRRYRQEYRSSLVGPKEAVQWAEAVLRSFADRTTAVGTSSKAIGLYFPARVTVELTDGRTESERVDLPEGSVANPNAAAAIEGKFIREVSPTLGTEGATAAWQAGLTFGRQPLRDVVRRFVRLPKSEF